MTMILYTLYIVLAIWLVRSFIQVGIGLGQIAMGLLVGVVGILLYVLSWVLEDAYRFGKLALALVPTTPPSVEIHQQNQKHRLPPHNQTPQLKITQN